MNSFFFFVVLVLGMNAKLFAQEKSHARNFVGMFEEVVADQACEHIFSQAEYRTTHYRTGSSGYLSLLRFEDTAADEDSELENPLGFFHKRSFFGRFGYNGDIYAEKEFEYDGRVYKVVEDGIVGREVIIVEMSVDVYAGDQSDERECSARGTYYGFQK